MNASPRGLGLYFLFIGSMGMLGALVALASVVQMAHRSDFLGAAAMSLYDLIMGGMALANLYVGFNLARLLIDRPHLPLRFARLGVILAWLSFNPINIVLAIYIRRQLERLAKEAEIPKEQRVLS